MTPLLRLLLILLALAGPAGAQQPHEAPVPGAWLDLDTGGHRAVIRALAVSPDGATLWSAGDDKVVRSWDLATGKPGIILRGQIGPGNEGTINALAVSADGARLAVAGYFGPHLAADAKFGDVRIFDTGSGRITRMLKGFAQVVDTLAFDPHSDRLAVSGPGGLVQLWSAPFSDQPALGPTLDTGSNRAMRVIWLAGGTRLAAATFDYGLRLFDAASGSPIDLPDGESLWDTPLVALAASPDGDRFALGGEDGTVQIRAASDGALVAELPRQPFRPDALSWGNGFLTVSCGYRCNGRFGSISYNDSDWSVRGEDPDAADIHAALPLPGGDRIALAGGRVPAIRIENGDLALLRSPLAGIGAPITGVAIAPDGGRIAWGTADPCPERAACPEVMAPLALAMQLPTPDLSIAGPKPLLAADRTMLRALLGGDGYALLSGRAPGSGFDASQLDIIGPQGALHLSRSDLDGYYYSAFGLVPERGEVITGGGNGVLLAQALADGRVQGEFVGHTSDVLALAVAPRAGRLVTGSADQTLKVWDLAARRLIATVFVAGEDWIVWTPEGYFQASPEGDRLVGWQVNQGPDREARFITARQLRQHLHSPEIVRRALLTGDAATAARELRGRDDELATLLSRPAPDFTLTIRPDLPAPDGMGVLQITGASLEEMQDWGFSVLVNDRRVQADRIPAPPGASDETGAPQWFYQIPVDNGANAILVSSEDDFGYITERSGVALFKAPRQAEKPGKLYLAVVGINRYPQLPDCGGRSCDLAFPVADAIGFLRTVKQHTAPLFAGVETLVIASREDLAAADPDGLVDPATVLDPDGRTITDALIEFLQQPGPDDTTVLFVASHGINVDEKFYLIPADGQKRGDDFRKASLVDWSVIQEEIGYAQGRRILMLDTCHAANAFNARLEKDAADARVIVFSATAANNTAQERRSLGHGVFTYSLIEGLSGGAAEGGEVRLLGLADFIYREVVRLTDGKQEPFYHISQTANFLLAKG